ncbi:uncharacterized protein LOC131501981 isoform X2 [Neofelis nebulosa]|nr:uncharacterized protein LOC131501981 isoform X2 [Neofelis nebulosa]
MAPSPNEGGRARAEAQRVGQRRERRTGGAGERPCPGQATGRLGGLHQTQGMISKVLTLPTSSPVAFTLGAVGWRAASSKSSPITCPWNLRTSLRCHPFLPTSPPLLQHLPGLRSLAISEPNRLPLGLPPGFRCPLPYCPSQLCNSEAVGVPGRHRLLPALPMAPCTRPLLRDTVPRPHYLSLGPFGLLQPNTTDSVAHLFLKFPEAGSPRPVHRDSWLLCDGRQLRSLILPVPCAPHGGKLMSKPPGSLPRHQRGVRTTHRNPRPCSSSKQDRDTPPPPAQSPFHALSSRLLTTLGACRAIPGSLSV